MARTTQTVEVDGRRLGLSNLGVGTGVSGKTLVLYGLTKANGNLYPGTVIPITFTFAKGGSTTLDVPVALTSTPTTGSVPPLPGGDSAE